MTLPNLFVAGAPKCGTTSMHNYLGQHPDIFMSPLKEPQFYCYAGQRPSWHGPGDFWMNDAIVADREQYCALFDGARDELYRGESSPYYLWCTRAQDRILADTPDARFILLLRDPVERAMSLWGHLWSQGRENSRTFVEGLRKEAERRSQGYEPFWYYRELGLYGEQLQRLLTRLPRDQLKVIYYDDLRADTRATLESTFRWLGLPHTVPIDTATRHMRTPRIPMTVRNRMLQSAVSNKAVVKRIVPQRLRRRVGRYALEALSRRSVETAASPPVPPDLRAHFYDDLLLLQSILGDVPNTWFDSRAVPRRGTGS